MRTNIEIDDELIAKAMAALGVKTKKEAVDLALRSALQKAAYNDLLAMRGQIEWEGDLEYMRLDKPDSPWFS